MKYESSGIQDRCQRANLIYTFTIDLTLILVSVPLGEFFLIRMKLFRVEFILHTTQRQNVPRVKGKTTIPLRFYYSVERDPKRRKAQLI